MSGLIIPPAPPPHGTVWAYHRGCRCSDCEEAYRGFLRELARRDAERAARAGRLVPRKASADDRARADPVVRGTACPSCGAPRHQRCRNLHFPLHYTSTHPARVAAYESGDSSPAARTPQRSRPPPG